MNARKNFIIVENPRDEEKTTKAGIIIKTQFDKADAYGIVCTVVSVGEGVDDIEVGEHVAVNYWDGVPFEIETKKFIGYKAEQVMAKIA
jgi:co-chaperonin GroES (HSP10)